MPAKSDLEAIVRDIKRQTRKKYNAEEKISIILEGLRGEESIAAICRREGINPNLYYRWSKEFLEAEKNGCWETPGWKRQALKYRTSVGRTSSSSNWWLSCH